MPYGPITPVAMFEHDAKYCLEGEQFLDQCNRVSGTLADNEDHRRSIRMCMLHQRFLFAGRIQRAVGSPLWITPFNCFVSGRVEDDSGIIFDRVKEAFMTMRSGGGIGYDFSELRPKYANIKSVNSGSSGAVSFMEPFDTACKVVRSAGGRRGAMMAVLRCDHPDIQEYIDVKQNLTELLNFNTSIGILDNFMDAVESNSMYDLVHEGSYGKVYKEVRAVELFNSMMRATYDWAEPGVLFLDTINRMNNLHYCETIAATNPCAEQPLPPYGACLLGSVNWAPYVRENGKRFIDWEEMAADIPGEVRAMDNVIDGAMYPLPQQEAEAKNKRRMGIGVTGVANAIEALGYEYGSDSYVGTMCHGLELIRDETYRASIRLAEEKGAFPLFKRDEFMDGHFVQTLPVDIRDGIARYGIRNSHLTSIAPTGTISLTADNITSGIEPVFALRQSRTIINPDATTRRVVELTDYGLARFGVEGKTADELSPEEHISVLCHAQRYVDSSISKTCNVGDDVTFERFKELYKMAYRGGAKGCTTFRASGKRFGVINKLETEVSEEGGACYINPETMIRTCE